MILPWLAAWWVIRRARRIAPMIDPNSQDYFVQVIANLSDEWREAARQPGFDLEAQFVALHRTVTGIFLATPGLPGVNSANVTSFAAAILLRSGEMTDRKTRQVVQNFYAAGFRSQRES